MSLPSQTLFNKACTTTLQFLLAVSDWQKAMFCSIDASGNGQLVAAEGMDVATIQDIIPRCNNLVFNKSEQTITVRQQEEMVLLKVYLVHTELQDCVGVLFLGPNPDSQIDKRQANFVTTCIQQLVTLWHLYKAGLPPNKPIGPQVTEPPISLTTFINSSNHSKVIVSADYTIIKFNQVAFELTKRLFGRGLQEGQHILTQMLPDVQEAFLTHFKEALEGNEVLSERTLPFGQLPTAWQIHYFPLKDAESKVIAVAITVTDVSELKQTQLALQQHQAILGKAQQIGQIGYFYTDIPSHYWHSSDVFDQILGLPSGFPKLMKSWYLLVHEEDREQLLLLVKQSIANKKTYQEEYRIVRPVDGAVRWVRGYIEMEFDANAVPKRLIGTVQDITEQKAAQLLLKESEEKFATTFNKSPVSVALTSMDDFTFLDFNEVFLEKTGYTKEEIIGKTTADLQLYISPEERDRVWSLNVQAGGVRELECLFSGKHQQELVGLMTSHQVMISGKKYFLSYIEDITERRKAQLALQKKQHQLQLVVEAANAGWWERDLINHTFYFSSKYWQMLGYNPTAINQESAFPDFHFLPAELAALNQLYQDTIALGKSDCEMELHLKHQNGSLISVLSRAYISRNTDGQAISIAGFNIDLSPIRTVEQQLRESEKRLQLVLDGSNDGWWDWEVATNTFIGSNSYFAMFGYKQTELVVDGALWRQLIHPDDLVYVMDYLQNNAHQQSHFEFELKFKHKQGHWVPVLVRGIILRNTEGLIERIAGTNVDLSYIKEVERALIIEKEKYRSISQLIEQSNYSIIVLNIDASVHWINNALELAGGFNIDEINGKSIYDVFAGPETDVLLMQQAFAEALNGRDATYEMALYPKSGEHFWSRVYVQALKNERGEVTQIFATAEYIGKEKAIQLALERSEAKYKSLVDSMSEIVFTTDAQANWTFLNKAWEAAMGYTVTESLGKSLYDFLHFEDVEKNKALFLPLIQQKKSYCHHSIRYINNKGYVKWMDVSAKLLFNEQNEIIGTIGTIADITEQKRNQHYYELLSKNVTDFIALYDLNAYHIYVAPSVKQILGYTPSELLERPLYHYVHADDIEIIRNYYNSYLHSQTALSNTTLRMVKKDGSITYLEATISAFVDEYESESRVLISAKVIDSRIEAEKQTYEALEKQQRLNELKTIFINTASHEFRTPLAIINSSVELIRMFLDRGKIDHDFFDTLQNIESETEALIRLVNDVLLLDKVSSGNISLNKQPTKLVNIIIGVIDRVSKKQHDKRKPHLEIYGTELEVMVDNTYIDIVITNLLSNALKYSQGQPEPIVTVYFDVYNVRIQIEDFGIGIPEQDKAQLFTTFFRAKNVKNIEGTGLGLNIVKHFIEQHNGTLSFSSIENLGSEFVVELPYQ